MVLSIDLIAVLGDDPPIIQKHVKCLGEYDYYGEFDCGYQSALMCEDCKYGHGRKDPEAKCNQM